MYIKAIEIRSDVSCFNQPTECFVERSEPTCSYFKNYFYRQTARQKYSKSLVSPINIELDSNFWQRLYLVNQYFYIWCNMDCYHFETWCVERISNHYFIGHSSKTVLIGDYWTISSLKIKEKISWSLPVIVMTKKNWKNKNNLISKLPSCQYDRENKQSQAESKAQPYLFSK